MSLLPPAAIHYSGGTSIVAGTLGVSASDALGSGGVSFDGANATLRIDDSGVAMNNALSFLFAAVLDCNGFDATSSGATSGGANVRKTGVGTLHWTGNRNHHSGNTTVDGGVLRLPGALPGNVIVAGGGTLAGAAQIGGNSAAQGGGALRPSEIRNPGVVNGDGGSGVAFDTPLLGTPILDYSALCTPGALSFTQAASPIVLLPLSNGVDYDCAITARNGLGSGPPVSVAVRPRVQLFGDGFE
jgi:autotransporter-associated beta strand protein